MAAASTARATETGEDDGIGDAAATPTLVAHATVRNRRGLHARAAAKFVSTAERFSATIEVEAYGQTVSAQSIMGLMMLGASTGTALEIRATGADAKDALAALAALVDAGFHEQD